MHKRQRILFLLLMCTIAAVSILTRLHGIGWKPLWLDEVVELEYTKPTHTFATVIDESARQVQPPLDYILLWQARKISESDFAARIPYAAYALLFCLVVWIWAARVFTRSGFIALTAWLAISSFHMFYAQEIRVYGLMMFLCAFYFLCLDSALYTRGWRSILAWSVCGIAGIAALYTNIFSAGAIAAGGIYAFAYSAINAHQVYITSGKKTYFRQSILPLFIFILVLVVIASAFYPYYSQVLSPQIADKGDSGVWNQEAKGVFDFWNSYRKTLLDFAIYPRAHVKAWWLIIAAAIIGIIPLRKRSVPFSATAFFMLLLYPPLMAYIFSQKTGMTFKSRYICQAFPFFALATGNGICVIAGSISWFVCKIKKQQQSFKIIYTAAVAVVICVIVALSLPSTYTQYCMEKSPWRHVANRIRKEPDKEHLITSQLDVSLRWNLQHYLADMTNWHYVGLEELPKMIFDSSVQLWVVKVVDARKNKQMNPNGVTNSFTYETITSFYPGVIYLFSSRKEIADERIIEATRPFSGAMDAYARITQSQYIALGKARRAAKKGDLETACAQYEKALTSQFKKDIWVALEYARLLYSHKMYDKAVYWYLTFFTEAKEQFRKDVAAEVIDVCRRTGKMDKAEELVEQYGTPELRTQLRASELEKHGRELLKEGSIMAAYTSLVASVELVPGNPTLYRVIAEICQSRLSPTRPDEAVMWNDRASETLLAKTGTRHTLADLSSAYIRFQQKKYTEAVARFNELIAYMKEHTPEDTARIVKAYEYLGITYERQKNIKQAYLSFVSALENAGTPAEKQSASSHCARIRVQLGK